MEIGTWNFIYPPPPSSNYFMTGPLLLRIFILHLSSVTFTSHKL
jgi:hypothetical protein